MLAEVLHRPSESIGHLAASLELQYRTVLPARLLEVECAHDRARDHGQSGEGSSQGRAEGVLVGKRVWGFWGP
jgi:hypothetical protein